MLPGARAPQEARYRKRYLDAIVNPFVRDIFATRAAIIRHIRRFFDDRGFLEARRRCLEPPRTPRNLRPSRTETVHHEACRVLCQLRCPADGS